MNLLVMRGVVGLLVVFLTGAGSADPLQDHLAAGVRACQAREREFRSMAALTKCYLDAEFSVRVVGYPYPDLLRLEMAERLANAQRFDQRAVGLAEMQAEDARITARIAAEARRRAMEERSVRALERAARRDPVVVTAPAQEPIGPIRCQTYRYGNSLDTICD
ncbi:hypothetical protein [Rhodoplanes sp. SY1]|uniref:hypothetical protein n=1 Tax=Rhodoplanes sp. SY1 TaxID=3166646 RepID=UPI0038B68973